MAGDPMMQLSFRARKERNNRATARSQVKRRIAEETEETDSTEEGYSGESITYAKARVSMYMYKAMRKHMLMHTCGERPRSLFGDLFRSNPSQKSEQQPEQKEGGSPHDTTRSAGRRV